MASSTVRLVEALVARLEEGLPTLLREMGLPPVSEVLEYDPGVPLDTLAPQVWVDVAADRRSAAGTRGATVHKYSHETAAVVGVSSASPEPKDGVRMLRGLVDAVRQCLEGDQTANGTALWVSWQATDYSPNLSGGPGLFQVAMLTFDVNRRTRVGAD